MNLVTGATGLVGSHMLLELLGRNLPVTGLYRKKEKIDLVEAVFGHYHQNPKTLIDKIKWVEADILDIGSLEDATKGIKHIYHAAAMVSFNPSDKKEIFKTNIEGTANVVNIALENGVKKLCHVSSTAAVGASKNGVPTDESFEWKKAADTSDYSISKYCAEKEVWRGVQEGLDAVVVNPSIILGPGKIDQSSSTLFKMVQNGLKYYTQGSNAFVDVRDVSKAMFQLMESSITNDRFLVISENLTYKKLIQLISNQFNLKSPEKEAKIWMSEIIWRLAYLQHLITGRKPWISKSSARSSQTRRKYSNSKLKETLKNFNFTPIENAIENAVIFIRSKNK